MSMFEMKEKQIGDVLYKVSPFAAMEALKLKATILKIFGPAIGKALAGLTSSTATLANTKIDGDSISGAFTALFEELDEDTFGAIVKRCLRNTTAIIGLNANGQQQQVQFADGREENLTIVFCGHLLDIYKLIYFVLEVNYPDFFDLIQNRLSGSLQKIQSLNVQKPSTSGN